MTLSSGTKLGGYEILALIGKGGMGEVYRARDTKLGREVAIKLLSEELSKDQERVDRLEREAKLLAQINHTNIATLYGFEEQNGQRFLVMELVEGETLAERIARGPVPVDEAVSLFLQIADGLESAHGKGIVHRDLKPANIQISPDGKIKILDFGLAKVFRDEPEALVDSSSQSPTLTKGTALGTLMGTASYMSPEQARGKTVDKRTDIWAFGCVLYEALTGRKAFSGDTVTDILAAIINTDPDFGPLPISTPRKVRELLRRCLQRDLRRRLRDMGDAWMELTDAGERESPGASWSAWVGLGVVVFLLGLGVGTIVRSTDVTPRGVRRLAIELPRDERFGDLWKNAVALSPDGTQLVYPAISTDGLQRLYVRPLDVPEATQSLARRAVMSLSSPRMGAGLVFPRKDTSRRYRFKEVHRSRSVSRGRTTVPPGVRTTVSCSHRGPAVWG